MLRIRLRFFFLALLCFLPGLLSAQTPLSSKIDLTQPQDYVLKRVSSADPTGANADFRHIEPGSTLTMMDVNGPGLLTHIWITVASRENYHLKKLILRIYWDHETVPSVEVPLGDFFGLGLGEYHKWESEFLSVGSDKALNCFFPMPFQKHARLTVSNEGQQNVDAFYFNLDYRALAQPLPARTLYLHAQFRQAQPNHGWTSDWQSNGDPQVDRKTNLDGRDNYTWLDATGHGHFVGVTMSVFQNQDGWWGEGDDMFFVDGESKPSINGTGSEDYFLGAWDFGGHPFSYRLYGAPVVGEERAGGKSSVYRFHLDSPIPFTKSLRATIEHGHANHRSDNYYSVAYWYQTEPHAAFPALPSVDQRIPRLQQVGGPGNPAVVRP
jgi:hypothetical protein